MTAVRLSVGCGTVLRCAFPGAPPVGSPASALHKGHFCRSVNTGRPFMGLLTFWQPPADCILLCRLGGQCHAGPLNGRCHQQCPIHALGTAGCIVCRPWMQRNSQEAPGKGARLFWPTLCRKLPGPSVPPACGIRPGTVAGTSASGPSLSAGVGAPRSN